MLVAAMLAVGSAAVWYADRAARESEQRWCGLIVTMDRAYREQPPTTPTGREMAARVGGLRESFGC